MSTPTSSPFWDQDAEERVAQFLETFPEAAPAPGDNGGGESLTVGEAVPALLDWALGTLQDCADVRMEFAHFVRARRGEA